MKVCINHTVPVTMCCSKRVHQHCQQWFSLVQISLTTKQKHAKRSTYFDSYDKLIVSGHGRVIRQRQETNFVQRIGSIWYQLTKENLQHQHISTVKQLSAQRIIICSVHRTHNVNKVIKTRRLATTALVHIRGHCTVQGHSRSMMLVPIARMRLLFSRVGKKSQLQTYWLSVCRLFKTR